jgi:hypothetical protein
MSFLKKLFSKEKKEENTNEISLPWIEASENVWGVRLLDLRPLVHTVLSTSKDPQMAANAVSYNQEDGISFIGQEPEDERIIEANISIPIDSLLAPGVLFTPEVMEHKWAIFFHEDTIIFIRGWLRKVFVIAKTRQHDNVLVIESIKGKFTENEEPAFTRAILKFLLISHSINEVVPAPLPYDLISSPKEAGLWAFSTYGNMAHAGVFEQDFEPHPKTPLRSSSLLHIAVARNDMKEVEKQVQAGISLNCLGSDGLAPLHWSIVTEGTDVMNQLLTLGANPDGISAKGATPMMNAVQSNKVQHLLLLIKWRANVNARDKRGFTALHRAAEMGHKEIVEILLDNGADKTIAAEGHTPLSLAEMRANEAIVELLR